MFIVNLTDEEISHLKEFKDPKKWEDWQELNKKQRYVFQRMIIGKEGAKDIVIAIAKEASHNLGHCRWCDHV